MHSYARITAQGAYVPEKILTNDDLEQMVETNDEWITSRTGIKRRHISEDNEYATDLAFKAVKNLETRYGKDLSDVDLIIVCTMSPEFNTPSVASHLQARLGISNCGTFDLNAACAGFTYGLLVANAMITSGMNRKVLVVASETLSKITDYSDRATCILFGDAAATFLVERDETNPSFITSYMDSEGERGGALYCSNLSNEIFDKPIESQDKIVQNGREVYKWAVSRVPKSFQLLLEKANLETPDIDWFVPHSANLRMLQAICKRLNLDEGKLLQSVTNYGNTSSATIPLAIDLAVKDGKLKQDQNLLLYGFGGGLTQAGTIIKWNPDDIKS
ncbi:ketoacyl-ACP synthase III [Staphylococcus massiliensis]|uniref:Beta-ketoacyl-[acyl-carrier-protein] synthase III n=1 Tax=Staphylococcus massiliensis S46 TaxID=1229783 RepID=K9ALK8_9STAP|nr:ketoacyl-ACP synthase III [Staphylococcus massiliensis]EKU48194.1 3-oxoacyl-(acyl carrier protein) synthase III [Staphylococcus massiliensis S46]MCG3399545.1 ketoacyl-ACP synthase III [Staphylococcus massiliensis]MCG3402055.1 ketoacyl-ACP synthase III [Staphylococcus massiliensis]MCG3412694.1 ketoacyl-ACP synthase III [Staphylococcus massiliensis]POA01007.1 ketoacyl-ACP synthase III [Staphylococcus massiliensis CCUG 55927]